MKYITYIRLPMATQSVDIVDKICYICKDAENKSPLYIFCNCKNLPSHYNCLAKWINASIANNSKTSYKCPTCLVNYPFEPDTAVINYPRIYATVFTIMNILLCIGFSYSEIDRKNDFFDEKKDAQINLLIGANLLFGALGVFSTCFWHKTLTSWTLEDLNISNKIVLINIIVGSIIYSAVFNKFTLNIFSAALGNTLHFTIVVVYIIYKNTQLIYNWIISPFIIKKNKLVPKFKVE